MADAIGLMNNAVVRTVAQYPYFASGILRLKLEEDNTLPPNKPAATNGTNIKFRGDFVQSLKPKERVFLTLHEWFHVMLCQHVRRGNRKPDVWGRACDYNVNDMLNDMEDVEVIEGSLIDRRFHGMTDYQIYDILIKEPQQEDKEKSRGQDGFDSIEDHPGVPENSENSPEQKQIEAEIKSQIADGMTSAKMAGKLPGNLLRLFGSLLESKVDWKTALANFVHQTSKDDFSYRKVNTRLAHTRLIFPSLWGERIESLIFVGDTSGSITEKETQEYGSDLVNAFESVNIQTLYVLWVDTRISSIQQFERGDEVILKPTGGGGTSFVPPFKWVEKEQIQPAGLVYLTDGECDDFADEPDYPVLWCVYGRKRDFNPPYGTVLVIDFN